MTLEELKTGLTELGIPVRHILAAVDEDCPLLCWQELGTAVLSGDNGPAARLESVQVDYFTTDEYDGFPVTVEGKLSDLNCGWTKEGITFDLDREEWRTVWTVQFLGG